MSYVRGKFGADYDFEEAGARVGWATGGGATSWDPVVLAAAEAAAEGLPADPETTIYAEEQPEAEPVKVATEQQQQEPPPMTDPAPPVGGGSALPLIAGVAVVAYLLVR